MATDSTNTGSGIAAALNTLEGCTECMNADPDEWENRVMLLTGGQVAAPVALMCQAGSGRCVLHLQDTTQAAAPVFIAQTGSCSSRRRSHRPPQPHTHHRRPNQ